MSYTTFLRLYIVLTSLCNVLQAEHIDVAATGEAFFFGDETLAGQDLKVGIDSRKLSVMGRLRGGNKTAAVTSNHQIERGTNDVDEYEEGLDHTDDRKLQSSKWIITKTQKDANPTYTTTTTTFTIPGTSTTTPGTTTTVAPDTPDTTRQARYLASHNNRRRAYHAKYGASFAPLVWNKQLADSAGNYANRLSALSGCVIVHGQDGDQYGGENLALNYGQEGPRSVDNIMSRWVEEEESLPYGQNGHFSQVLWRGSRYVGCGETTKLYVVGGQSLQCHIQVCRYLSPGNCNADASGWQQQMLADSTPCTPQCPGC